MQDVIIIGGGVIGLSLACELAKEGLAVSVLDQGQMGQESSWAGAGILPPGNSEFARLPEARLRAASHALWPTWSARLRDETGIDNGFRNCGGLEVQFAGTGHSLDDEIAAWRREGVAVEPLSSGEARDREPALAGEVTSAYRLPEMGQVRNPRHVKALVSFALKQGVTLSPGTCVYDFDRADERIAGVETSSGKQRAGRFVIASGAWSTRLLAEVGCHAAVRPIRGQIVLLSHNPSRLTHVVNVGSRYLVPRGDGRLLVGATEEVAGFDKRTTGAGLAGLTAFAIEVIPELAGAGFERAWAGLRPQSADGLPYLGRAGGMENLFVASGHFRAGLQLSPITAVLMCQLMLGRETTIPLAPYSADRHVRPPAIPNSVY